MLFICLKHKSDSFWQPVSLLCTALLEPALLPYIVTSSFIISEMLALTSSWLTWGDNNQAKQTEGDSIAHLLSCNIYITKFESFIVYFSLADNPECQKHHSISVVKNIEYWC